MKQDLHSRLQKRSAPIEFKKSITLFGATTLGIGAMMGAGLYVLVGVAAAQSGPGLWLAYAICGGLTFLSALMFADFAKQLPISGGGYVYAYKQLGSFWGFMVGWHLAIGSIFACALYAFGFAYYVFSFITEGPLNDWLVKSIAIGMVILLTAFGLKSSKGGERAQRFFTWGNMIVLAILLIGSAFFISTDNYSPMLPNGLSGIGASISLIYISFFGYQLIANSAEEIKSASKTVPQSMLLSMGIAFVFYIVIAVAAVGVVHWEALAASDAPLVSVAIKCLGPMGAKLIGVGGILASAAALNSTLASQGRQLFAMGRDRMLFRILGGVSPKTNIPVAALSCGAIATIAAIILSDLTFIAKAANFAFLFSMLPISFALHSLYKQNEAENNPVPLWRRALPWAAFLANAGLLFTLDNQSLWFGGTIVAVGCIVFMSYSYTREKRARMGMSISLDDEEKTFSFPLPKENILVPMSNPRTLEALLSLSRAIMPPGGGVITTLNVVPVETGQELREALRSLENTQRAINMGQQVETSSVETDVVVRRIIRASRTLSDGIVHAAQEERSTLIVMGWATDEEQNPSTLLTQVASKSNTDFVFLKLNKTPKQKKIGVALGGMMNLPLMVKIASAIAEQYNGQVTYFSVVKEHFDKKDLHHARNIQSATIKHHTKLVPYKIELMRCEDPLSAIVKRSRKFDMLIVGTAPKGVDDNVVGSFSTLIADKAQCSVVLVRRSPQMAKQWQMFT